MLKCCFVSKDGEKRERIPVEKSQRSPSDCLSWKRTISQAGQWLAGGNSDSSKVKGMTTQSSSLSSLNCCTDRAICDGQLLPLGYVPGRGCPCD